MDKKKGLADNGDGEFILNESGTSVTVSTDEENQELPKPAITDDKQNATEDHKGSSGMEEKDFTD